MSGCAPASQSLVNLSVLVRWDQRWPYLMGITESKGNRSAELQHITQQEHTERAAKLSRQPQPSSLLIYSEWIHPLRTSRGFEDYSGKPFFRFIVKEWRPGRNK